MTPLDNPGIAFAKSGTLEGTGTIDWIEFELFNTDSDFYPTAVATAPPAATDFYIRSMVIVIPEPGTASLVLVGVGMLAGLARIRTRKRE